MRHMKWVTVKVKKYHLNYLNDQMMFEISPNWRSLEKKYSIYLHPIIIITCTRKQRFLSNSYLSNKEQRPVRLRVCQFPLYHRLLRDAQAVNVSLQLQRVNTLCVRLVAGEKALREQRGSWLDDVTLKHSEGTVTFYFPSVSQALNHDVIVFIFKS